MLLDIQRLAQKHGINWQGKTKTDIIREIQACEGNFDCFGKSQGDCNQFNCTFRQLCLPKTKTVQSDELQSPEIGMLRSLETRYYSTGYLSYRHCC